MKTLQGFQKGVNLGGWLSQGPKDEQHLRSFIREENIAEIASWGCDHVRLPLDFENVENTDGSRRDIGYERIHACLGWCRKHGLNLVLDLHKTFGYIFDDPSYSGDFFDSPALQERFYSLWDKMAREFAPDTDIVMFDILNEVVRSDVAEKWNDIAEHCIRLIRGICPTVKILYGGVCYNAVTTIKLLREPLDENIVYNFHCYSPLLFTHQGAHWMKDMPIGVAYPGSVEDYMAKYGRFTTEQMKGEEESVRGLDHFGPDYFEGLFAEAIAIAEARGVPLYCGEYGVIDLAPLPDTVRWYGDINRVFRKYGIGHAAWNYKEKDFGLSGEHYAPILEELKAVL